MKKAPREPQITMSAPILHPRKNTRKHCHVPFWNRCGYVLATCPRENRVRPRDNHYSQFAKIASFKTHSLLKRSYTCRCCLNRHRL